MTSNVLLYGINPSHQIKNVIAALSLRQFKAALIKCVQPISPQSLHLHSLMQDLGKSHRTEYFISIDVRLTLHTALNALTHTSLIFGNPEVPATLDWILQEYFLYPRGQGVGWLYLSKQTLPELNKKTRHFPGLGK